MGTGAGRQKAGRPTGHWSSPSLVPFALSSSPPKWAEHRSEVQASWVSGLTLFLPGLDFSLRGHFQVSYRASLSLSFPLGIGGRSNLLGACPRRRTDLSSSHLSSCIQGTQLVAVGLGPKTFPASVAQRKHAADRNAEASSTPLARLLCLGWEGLSFKVVPPARQTQAGCEGAVRESQTKAGF